MGKHLNRLDRATYYALGKELEKVGRVVDGHWIYQDGYNDRTVADKLSLSPAAVGNTRRALFAELPRSVNGSPMSRAFDRIKALEEKVDALQRLLSKPSVIDAAQRVVNGRTV